MSRTSIVIHHIVIAALAAGALAGCRAKKGQAGGPPPAVPVVVAQATVQSMPLDVRVVGSVEPSSKVEIKSQVAGPLIKVHFVEGQDVKEGQLLLEIDPQPYRETLRQAQAAVERDKAQLAQAEFALKKDVVQSKNADADASRYAALAKEKIISTQTEQQYRTNAEAMQESIRVDQAAIESARAALQVDEAAVSQAKLNLGYCEVRAPISGRSGNLLVHAGNLVKANDTPLVVINRISPVFVSFNVTEKHLEAIRRFSAGRELPIVVTTRDNSGMKSSGRLSVIDNTVDTQTGTIKLKGVFENGNHALWPGQFVDVVLTLDAGHDATVIPSEAVQAGQKGQFVYVVKADNTVEPRVVLVGRTVERRVVVESGVAPGETVVTDGQLLLFPGAHVILASVPKTQASAN